jgi:hypothetical protein
MEVTTVLADARSFALERCVSLAVVPMQTLQLLGGPSGREAFMRCAIAGLEPDGLVAAALADALDSFDEEHVLPPPPDVREILGVRYASQLLSVVQDGSRAAIHRRREVTGPDGTFESQDVVVHLDRVTAAEVEAEARRLGFVIERRRFVPQTEEYLGATVVLLRAP